MIAALMLVTLTGSSCWLIHWATRSAQGTTPTAASDQHAPRTAAVLGLEDDPDQWHAWTALDERQLIRLLTDSAQ